VTAAAHQGVGGFSRFDPRPRIGSAMWAWKLKLDSTAPLPRNMASDQARLRRDRDDEHLSMLASRIGASPPG